MPGKRQRNPLVPNPAHAIEKEHGGESAMDVTKASEQKSDHPASWQFWLPLGVCVLLVSNSLLFYRLGHYPLWCDEADTALFARGVMRTGDLSAVIGDNIVANRSGACLQDLRNRYQPPLPYYLAAPFVGTDGTSAFWPRLPFAVCGSLSVLLMLYWMARSQLSITSWIVLVLGLFGNVSFFLYCRQSRYFALAILLTVTIGYLYLHWNGKWWKLAAMLVASLLLLATHYLAYAGLYAALACDYFLFERRRQRFPLAQFLWLLVPQVLIGGFIVWVYNPIGSAAVPHAAGRNWVFDKLTLLWFCLRDMNACEFGVGLLMLFAPALYFLNKNKWLLRAPFGIWAYVVTVTICSPQPLEISTYYDIRYISALIPLCIFTTALAVLALSWHKWFIAIPLALVAFGTNVLNFPLQPSNWHSALYQWIGELEADRITSTQRVIDWIDKYVQPGQSVWVVPLELFTYPLMYHDPSVVYAWQLEPPPKGQFRNLPPIDFYGNAAPDYIIVFGRQAEAQTAIREYKKQLNVDYLLADTLDVFWNDLTRPELYSHTFKPVIPHNAANEAVYIWRRSGVDMKTK
jgi:hypothetical protein